MVQLVEILPCEDKVTCILCDPNHSCWCSGYHYIDVIMTTMASQITSLLNRLFWRRSKKTSKLRVTGLCAGNSPGPVNSPHKGPVTRNMFPFDDVIMTLFHPEVMAWKHFPHYWSFVGGIHWWSIIDILYKGTVMQNFDMVFDVSLNKLLNKQLNCW